MIPFTESFSGLRNRLESPLSGLPQEIGPQAPRRWRPRRLCRASGPGPRQVWLSRSVPFAQAGTGGPPLEDEGGRGREEHIFRPYWTILYSIYIIYNILYYIMSIEFNMLDIL